MRRRFRRSYAIDHGDLISKPSYAPIAAVWVAIAALAIAAYRPPTHAVLVDLPIFGDVHDISADVPRYTVRITPDSRIMWNGEELAMHDLIERIQATREEPQEPLLVFEPDGDASYEVSARVLAVIDGMGVNKFCFGGIAQYRHFGDASEGDSVSPVLMSTSLDISMVVLPPLPISQTECDLGIDKPRS